MPRLVEFFFVPNLIDYARVYLLYLAYAQREDGFRFAAWYVFSYILDVFDGMAARALNQESRLGYYLDMVIDRMSTCLCLHLAAGVVRDNNLPGAEWQVPVLYGVLVSVEIVAHGAVVFASEVLGVHQKFMGHDWLLVRLYLGGKPMLFFACASFEGMLLSIIMGLDHWITALFVPGFVFRSLANLARLAAMATSMVSGTSNAGLSADAIDASGKRIDSKKQS